MTTTDLHSRHIELDAGTITQSEDEADLGQDLFMVLLVEAGGSYAMMAGHRERDRALQVAADLAEDFGLPLVDKTGPVQ